MIAQPEKMVGIAGGSCSGKTTLETSLRAKLGDAVAIFPFDDMFVGLPALEGREIDSWEDPSLYRWNDFESHVKALKLGATATIIANSRESKEAGISTRDIEPRRIVVVAGFLALHSPAARELFDLCLYIDLPETEIVRRRIGRARSDKPWDTMEYITGGLLSGHRQFVAPQRKVADYVVEGMLSQEQLANEVTAIITAD
jgi:uridine kinase